LRAEARKAESRVEKLLEMQARLDEMLADPDIYAPGRLAEAEKWQRKRAEVAEALERAEALWLEAMDALEQAGATTS
ncbi:MAG: ABC transporter ATP-binding protein, partial [Alphaproteobacteria bacterium]